MDYEKVVSEIGLPEKEAAVYAALLKLGEGGAKELLPVLSGIKRANLYALLGSLQQKGLVTESEKPGKMRFRPETPEKLRDLVSNRLNRAKEAEGAFERALPLLVSQFNLMTGKPVVSFFEGVAGLNYVLRDTLTAESDIYAYIDSDRVHKDFEAVNSLYVTKRFKLGIKKKILYIDTPAVRARAAQSNPQFTETRLLPKDTPSFGTTLQIYDNKISYMVLDKEKIVSILITDPSIALMHKALFEATWKTAEDVTPPLPEKSSVVI